MARLFALGSTLLLVGCGAVMPENEVDRIENDIVAVAEGRGLTVGQIDLRAQSKDSAAGEAMVALRDDPARQVRWDCRAERRDGTRLQWRCAPPGRQPASDDASSADGRAAFAGRWTDTGDCNVVTYLNEDGSFVAPNGARGSWDAGDALLTFTGPNGTATLRVYLEDPNTMVVTTPDGTTSRSTRC